MTKKTPRKKTAKKAPKKKAPKKKAPKPSIPARAKVVVDVPPLHQDARNGPTRERQLARFEAGVVFTTTLTQISIPDLQKDPRFADIPIDTLYRWSKEDKWLEHRKAMLARVREGLDARLQTHLSEQVYAWVKTLNQLKSTALEEVMRKGPDGEIKLKPTSWEGMAKVIMAADKQLDEIRQTVYEKSIDTTMLPDNLDPRAPARLAAGNTTPRVSGQPPESSFHYDEDELREAAKAITKKRRDAVRAREEARKIAEGVAKKTKKQKLKIVNIQGGD